MLIGGWSTAGSTKHYFDMIGLEQEIVLEAAMASDDDEFEFID